ncbi:MAG: toxin [Actinomycetota bacterium]
MIIYDKNKAIKLRYERNIEIEDILDIIIHKKYLDILEHPKRAGQQIFILEYRDYIHVVPFVIDNDNNIIIKTVFPSRNFHKIYKEELK